MLRIISLVFPLAVLASQAHAGGGSFVALHRVEVDPQTAMVTVEYSKDFATCAHLKDASGQLVHASNFFCASGNNVVVTQPLTSFNGSFAVGVQVRLCHGNNANICSPFVTVTSGVCQPDLGFGGPGDVKMSVCGDALATGGVAAYEVESSLPNAPGLLFVSLFSNPTFVPSLGGTLVPVPILVTLSYATGPTGDISVPGIPGGGGPISVYAQTVIADASQPKGFAVSNALRIDFLP